jgi:serine/threonine protein kinase
LEILLGTVDFQSAPPAYELKLRSANLSLRVFRAYNHQSRTLAACKVILLSKQVPKSQRKDLYKEIKVHSQLKHDYILEFLDSKIVEDDDTTAYVPGVYMLMELAGGGDLFDKIGVFTAHRRPRLDTHATFILLKPRTWV